MLSYLVRRLVFMVPTLLGITLMVFMLLALAPGGIGAGLAVQGGQMSDTSRVAQMQAYMEDRYGLNDPVIVQYARWLGRLSPVKFGTRDLRDGNGERVPGRPSRLPPATTRSRSSRSSSAMPRARAASTWARYDSSRTPSPTTRVPPAARSRSA
ncbi:MAG: hypothetical protein EBU31_04435 [Proteobacteria bacterium]|nr:hypothetical protein [Pseudomonadota bacterium]